jgi:hypothetical protein
MVSTLDFESNDPGSNPGKTYNYFFKHKLGTIAQLVRASGC